MAFYSQYTGQNINPVPAGYLQANAQSARMMQQGLASIGEAIGKYRKDKEQDEQDEMVAKAFEMAEAARERNKSKKGKGKGKGKSASAQLPAPQVKKPVGAQYLPPPTAPNIASPPPPEGGYVGSPKAMFKLPEREQIPAWASYQNLPPLPRGEVPQEKSAGATGGEPLSPAIGLSHRSKGRGVPAPYKPRVQGLDAGIPAPEKGRATGEDIAEKKRRVTVNSQLSSWLEKYGKDANADTIKSAYLIFDKAREDKRTERVAKQNRRLLKGREKRDEERLRLAQQAEARAQATHDIDMSLVPEQLKGMISKRNLTDAQTKKTLAEFKEATKEPSNEIKILPIAGMNYAAVQLPGSTHWNTLPLPKPIVKPTTQEEVDELNRGLTRLGGEDGKPPAQWVKVPGKENEWRLLNLNAGSLDLIDKMMMQMMTGGEPSPKPPPSGGSSGSKIIPYKELRTK